MSKKVTSPAATAAILLGLASNVSVAAVNLSCDAYTDDDALLWARYIDTGDRKAIDVTVKLSKERPGLAEQPRPVFVGTEKIGDIIPANRGGENRKGGLSLSSNADYATSGDLPPNWPGAGIGTLVRVGNLSCQLEG